MFLKVNHAATKVQALGRIIVARNYVREYQRRIVRCQSYGRRYARRRDHLCLRASVLRIQAAVRGHFECAAYRSHLRDVRTVQSVARRNAALKAYGAMHAAAREVQAFYRGHARRRGYARARRAVVAAQAFARMAPRRARHVRYLARVVRAQAVARARVGRWAYGRLYSAAIKLQYNYRRHVYRKKQRRLRHFIKFLNSRKRSAALSIQRFYRLRLAYRDNCAAFLQAHVRGMQCRGRLWTESVEQLGRDAEDRFRARHALLTDKASVVQRAWRMASARATLAFKRYVRDLQRMAEKVLQEQREGAATRIQSTLRMHWGRRRAARALKTVTTVQGAARRRIARRRARRRRAAIVRIQAVYRTRLVGRRVVHLNDMAHKIQTWYKAHGVKKAFRKIKRSVVVAQTFVRCRQGRRRFTVLKASVVYLQKSRRVVLWRRMVRRLNKNVTKVQAKVRCCLQRGAYLRVLRGILSLQTHARRRQARRKLVLLRQSDYVVMIQALARGSLKRSSIWRAVQLMERIVAEINLRRKYNYEYKVLLENARERHEVHKVLNHRLYNDAPGAAEQAEGGREEPPPPALTETAPVPEKGEGGAPPSAPALPPCPPLPRPPPPPPLQLSDVGMRYLVAEKLSRDRPVPKSKYLQLVRAAVIIQSMCRGIICRRRTIRLHKTIFRVQETVRRLNRAEEVKRLFPAAPTKFFTPLKQGRRGGRAAARGPVHSTPRRHLPSDFRLKDHPMLSECKSVYTRLSPFCMRLLIKGRSESELLDSMRAKTGQVTKAQSLVRRYLARCRYRRALSRKRSYVLKQRRNAEALGIEIPPPPPDVLATLFAKSPPPEIDDSLPPPASLPHLDDLCRYTDSQLDIFHKAESVLQSWQARQHGIVRFQARVRGALARTRERDNAVQRVREQAISMFMHQTARSKGRAEPGSPPAEESPRTLQSRKRGTGKGNEFQGYWW